VAELVGQATDPGAEHIGQVDDLAADGTRRQAQPVGAQRCQPLLQERVRGSVAVHVGDGVGADEQFRGVPRCVVEFQDDADGGGCRADEVVGGCGRLGDTGVAAGEQTSKLRVRRAGGAGRPDPLGDQHDRRPGCRHVASLRLVDRRR
jgi:hypothetical protein